MKYQKALAGYKNLYAAKTNAALDIVGIYRKGFGFLNYQTFSYGANIIATYKHLP